MAENRDYKKALQLHAKGEHEKAIHFFNLAIKTSPEDPDIFSDRAVTYFHLRKNDLSLADLDHAVKLQPDYSYRYSSRAYVKDKMGDTEGAIEDYKKAIELDPEDAIAHNNLGLLEEKLGYIKKSKRHFDLADQLAEEQLKQNGVKNEPPDPQAIQTHPKKKQKTIGQIMLDVFRSKKAFLEYLKYIKNGFRSS